MQLNLRLAGGVINSSHTRNGFRERAKRCTWWPEIFDLDPRACKIGSQAWVEAWGNYLARKEAEPEPDRFSDEALELTIQMARKVSAYVAALEPRLAGVLRYDMDVSPRTLQPHKTNQQIAYFLGCDPKTIKRRREDGRQILLRLKSEAIDWPFSEKIVNTNQILSRLAS